MLPARETGIREKKQIKKNAENIIDTEDMCFGVAQKRFKLGQISTFLREIEETTAAKRAGLISLERCQKALFTLSMQKI